MTWASCVTSKAARSHDSSARRAQASNALEMPAETMNLMISEPGMSRATLRFASASINRAAVRYSTCSA
jgi:hypothetical protein